MKEALNELNTYFWNVGNDIADIRLLAEGAFALFEGDAEPLHRLGMKNNEEVAASAFDTIGTALYDLRERIAEMQTMHLQETLQQGTHRKTEGRAIKYAAGEEEALRQPKEDYGYSR